MKTIIKRAAMWLHSHGVLSDGLTAWMLRTFGLRGA
jgi:hypothetical protein